MRKFNSDVNLKAHVGNIKDDMFDVNFFKTFDIVLNALDNLGKEGGMDISPMNMSICWQLS